MSTKPYFSIVIPTKNRPDYLKQSIKSVLLQNFENFELIVSDNYNDISTKEAINQFIDNPKLNYYRTNEELSMNNHWEWATQKAKGTYVILLPDRKLLTQNSLKKLYKFLHIDNKDNLNCVTYGVKTYNENKNYFEWYAPLIKTKKFSSIELANNFLNTNYFEADSLDSYFPKTLNSCFKNEYAQSIRKKYGNYFNNYGVTTPDYSSFIINIALNKECYFFSKHVIVSQGEQTSNGRNFGAGKFQDYLKTLNISEQELYYKVPVNAPFIYNWLMIDFLRIKDKFKGYLSEIDINYTNYFSVLNYELNLKKELKQVNEDVINYFETELNEGLKKQNINYEKIKLFNKSVKPDGLINRLAKRPIAHMKDYIKHNYPNNKTINHLIGNYYHNALEAAGFNLNLIK